MNTMPTSGIDTKTVYVHSGASVLLPFKTAETQKNEWENKPAYGLWACRYLDRGPYISDWENYKERMNPFSSIRRENDNYFLFRLTEDANILTINDVADYKNISSKLKTPKGFLDFTKIKFLYDAVEFTKGESYWMDEIPFTPTYYMMMWRVPSIIVLKQKVIRQIPRMR